MNKFWELYEKNAVISGVLAVILVGSCCALPFFGHIIPPALIGFAGAAVGYYFGAGKAAATVEVIKRKGKC